MKATQITVIKNKEVLGTVLRATTVSNEELVMELMQGNDEGLVIEPGSLINVGVQWYYYTATGFQDITGSADWNTNTAWFYDVSVFNKAVAENMEFAGFDKNTVLKSYVQVEQAATAEPQDPMAGEAGAKNVNDMKKQTKEKTKKRLFGKKHGKTKEKVSQEGDADITFCSNGILFMAEILRKNKMDDLASQLCDLLYDTDGVTAKSLRNLAATISAEAHARLEEHIKFARDKSAMDIVTLKSMFDENGNEKHRSIFDMLVELLIWVYTQMQEFAKQWSKDTVFLPFRAIMAVFKLVLDIVRTFVGVAFYVVNGVVCLVNAVLWKLEEFVFGVVAFLRDEIANWKAIKDEPVMAA